MTTLAQEAIAVLLDLAQRGEIDPWDVQVIEVVDRYLSKIGLNEQNDPEQQETNLPQSGQTLLWASMLVLLKANTLEASANATEEEGLEEVEPETMGGVERALPLHLERHIRRRPTAPPAGRRRVTLEELIEQIQQMAAVLDATPARPERDRVQPQSRKATARAIAQLAHNENLTELTAQLEEFLNLQLPQLLPDRADVDLDQLLQWWVQAIKPQENENLESNLENSPQTRDRVGVFWALLLLSAQSKVELLQEEFYQDLKIRPIKGQTLLE
ncbi:segregation/condensation protein A [Lusitaniella coriacea LEGE 07157]|uniref:Segregation and condensation protein A n=1 Tax=Lusitaniella coriacea LEGE 07157 TaxID=945747 RepID=A0A8J7J6P4_9CYAN|nr:segregation/condensation protein A [Lusitaniella coriacea]MBE9118834.1 segregation/condensation protein A [Lusitaniella coriacea LEGE 07157]